MEKQTLLPKAGDSLVIGKYLSGFDRRGNPVMSNGRNANSLVAAVYEDGSVRSKEGDVFEVQLSKRPTTIKTKQGKRTLPAQWLTVA